MEQVYIDLHNHLENEEQKEKQEKLIQEVFEAIASKMVQANVADINDTGCRINVADLELEIINAMQNLRKDI